MAATLISIQVGKPAVYDAGTQHVWESGIFKTSLDRPVWLGKINLEGDGQQDLRVHGGLFRAVLSYSADYYPTWREVLQQPDFPYGAFGENFSIAGLDETSVHLADIYRVGAAVIQVTQPRQPCWKLARRWNNKRLTAMVHSANRGGWYTRVLEEGEVAPGQAITLVDRSQPLFPIARVNALMNGWEQTISAYEALAEIEALTPEWRSEFANRLEKAEG
jgi:MOSC domain-containing protein YiiM